MLPASTRTGQGISTLSRSATLDMEECSGRLHNICLSSISIDLGIPPNVLRSFMSDIRIRACDGLSLMFNLGRSKLAVARVCSKSADSH